MKLFLVQAMWGMIDLPTKQDRWNTERQLELIKEAGFDAIDLDIPYVVGKENEWRGLLENNGLRLGLQGPFVHNRNDLEKCLDVVEKMGAPYLDAQVGDAFIPEAKVEELLRGLCNRAAERGALLCVQTHRGRVTQDLLRTVGYCRAIPELRLNLDLSHYFVGGEFGLELPEAARSAFDVLLKHTSMIDGRVSNGQQIQIDIGAEGESPFAKNFYSLWKKAMVDWLKEAAPGDLFVFRPELGPPPYSILDLTDREISNRWEQAKVFARIGCRLWNEAVRECGRGQPHGLV